MRRPLFWVCLFLSLTAALHFLLTGGFDAGYGWEGPPGRKEEVVLAGQVCGRETGDQRKIFLIEIDFSKSSQFAASSRQVISYLIDHHTEKLRCRLAAEACEAMPKIGSFLTVSGKFTVYEGAANPGEFDFAEYYRANGVGGQLEDTVILDSSAGYSRLREGMFQFREFLGERLDRVFPEREAGVMKTMLLGDRSDLDRELKELYREGGIVHILSISGLHITLLGMGIYRLLRKLGVPNGVSALAGGLLLVLYGIMTGMSVSACRAIGMFLLRMLGQALGRTYDMLTALAALGAGMLCLAPRFLLHSGFWLSFGSLFGVGCVLPVMEELAGAELETDGPLLRAVDRWMLKIRKGRGRRGSVAKEALLAGLRSAGGGIAGGLRGGSAVLLATLPLQLRFYYEIPVFSMAVNLLVLPCMELVAGCGFLAMMLPFFPLFAAVDILALRCFEGLCRFINRLPFHTWNAGCPELWQIGLYYAGLVAVLLLLRWKSRRARSVGRGVPAGYRLRKVRGKLPGCLGNRGEMLGKAVKQIETRGEMSGAESRCSGAWGGMSGADAGRNETRRKTFGAALEFYKIRWWEWSVSFVVKWLVIFLPVAVLALPVHRNAGLTFLDVGQGDGVCMRTVTGETWLYDCGSSSKSRVGENILIPFLKHEGIRRIHGVILSHGDKDHVSGLLELFRLSREEGIRIDRVILPELGEGAEEESFSEILTYEKDGLFEVIRVRAGERFGGKGLSFAVLNPVGSEKESDNASSLCLLAQLETRGETVSVMLTGDVEGLGEKVLLAELEKLGVRSVDVLKCAHHGSKNATSNEFLEAVDARIAVISCGKNNSYGHPHAELLERLEADGAALFRTDLSGAVKVDFQGERCRIATFLGDL